MGKTSRTATNPGRQQLAAIGLLADELRQRLYRFVAAQPTPVTRDQAAAAAGISSKLAAFHSTSWPPPGCWRPPPPTRPALAPAPAAPPRPTGPPPRSP